MKIHPQSLLKIPLIDFVMNQQQVPIIPRPIQSGWNYKGILSIVPNGFNPFCGSLFYADSSAFARWRPNARRSAAPYNQRQWLLYECLFMVHDYLHLWAISEMLEDLIHLKNDELLLTKEIIGDLEFVFIISEAAATTGLDFWYLSRTDLNALCPIGARLNALTSSYRESDIDAYQALNKDFCVQDPSFFDWISKGYCTGEFSGFSADDLRSNEKLSGWLGKEVYIAHKQLLFIRYWLRYLAGMGAPTAHAAGKPIDLKKGNRETIIKKLGKKLWRIASGELLPEMRPYQIRIKTNSLPLVPDYRFTNIRAMEHWEELTDLDFTEVSIGQFGYFATQYLSAFKLPPDGSLTREIVDQLIREKDTAMLKKITSSLAPVPNGESGPRDLVFVN